MQLLQLLVHLIQVLLNFFINPEAHLSQEKSPEHDAQLAMHSVYFFSTLIKNPDPIFENSESLGLTGTVMPPIFSLVRTSVKICLNTFLGKI